VRPGLQRLFLVLFGTAVFALCLSFSAFLFHWRIENEPGASPDLVFLRVHRLLLLFGLTGSLCISFAILRRELGSPMRLILPTVLALLVYSPLFAITILLMV